MKYKRLIIVFLLSCIMSIGAKAQQSDDYYSITLTPTGQVLNEFDTLYSITMSITFLDVSNIDKVFVKVKKSSGSDFHINTSFKIIGTNNLPQGVTLQRNGNIFNLALSPVSALNIEDIDIRTQDNHGNTSEKLKFK